MVGSVWQRKRGARRGDQAASRPLARSSGPKAGCGGNPLRGNGARILQRRGQLGQVDLVQVAGDDAVVLLVPAVLGWPEPANVEVRPAIEGRAQVLRRGRDALGDHL